MTHGSGDQGHRTGGHSLCTAGMTDSSLWEQVPLTPVALSSHSRGAMSHLNPCTPAKLNALFGHIPTLPLAQAQPPPTPRTRHSGLRSAAVQHLSSSHPEVSGQRARGQEWGKLARVSQPAVEQGHEPRQPTRSLVPRFSSPCLGCTGWKERPQQGGGPAPRRHSKGLAVTSVGAR